MGLTCSDSACSVPFVLVHWPITCVFNAVDVHWNLIAFQYALNLIWQEPMCEFWWVPISLIHYSPCTTLSRQPVGLLGSGIRVWDGPNSVRGGRVARQCGGDDLINSSSLGLKQFQKNSYTQNKSEFYPHNPKIHPFNMHIWCIHPDQFGLYFYHHAQSADICYKTVVSLEITLRDFHLLAN